jgi:hypothetical protein
MLQKNDKSNVFRQLGDFWQKMNSKENAMVRTAYLDNPDQVYDDFLLPTRIMLGLAVFVTLAFGGYYHYHIFKSAFGLGAAAILGSLLWFLVIEITKVYFGLRVARSISSGACWSSFTKLIFSSIIMLIVTGAFWLSIEISTKSVAAVNMMLRQEQLLTHETFSPPPGIAELDKQIAAAEVMSAKAQKSTWRGRPTTEGLSAMRQAETTKQTLLRQKDELMSTARQDFEAKRQLSQNEITASSQQLAAYGGIAEYATILLIILLALLERISYEHNKGKVGNSQEGATHRVSPKQPGKQAIPSNPYTERGQSLPFSDNRIGFRLPGNREKSIDAVTKPVTAIAETPVTVVNTAVTPVTAEPVTASVTVVREVVTDPEREIAEKLRRIKQYFYKWQHRGKGGGLAETILKNIKEDFAAIMVLQNKAEISHEMKIRIIETHDRYLQMTGDA